jgi:uncharacterized protein YwgA
VNYYEVVETMGTIGKDTYRRIYILSVIGSFDKGVFGKTRLQKTVYESQKDIELKPFTYTYRDYGQYSDELTNILEQLLSMSYLSATPQPSERENPFNNFTLGSQLDKATIRKLSERVLGAQTLQALEAATQRVGYLKEADLLNRMHAELDKAGIEKYQLVLKENLPDEVTVDLDDDECENLDLVLNPNFRSAMSKFADACSSVSFDTSKVKRVYRIDR